MGTYSKGILGPFSGKVGTVVGANWRGKNILRSLPKKTVRTPSEIQLLQQQKFAAVSAFLTPIAPVLSRYFGLGSTALTRRNQAMSYHLLQAVTYAAPDFVMEYTKVLIAKGDLPGIQNPVVTASGSNSLHYTWQDNSGQGQAESGDLLVVVVYEPLSGQFMYLLNAAIRGDETAYVILPASFAGLEVQSWITFASADESRYATSVYMGATTVL